MSSHLRFQVQDRVIESCKVGDKMRTEPVLIVSIEKDVVITDSGHFFDSLTGGHVGSCCKAKAYRAIHSPEYKGVS